MSSVQYNHVNNDGPDDDCDTEVSVLDKTLHSEHLRSVSYDVSHGIDSLTMFSPGVDATYWPSPMLFVLKTLARGLKNPSVELSSLVNSDNIIHVFDVRSHKTGEAIASSTE